MAAPPSSPVALAAPKQSATTNRDERIRMCAPRPGEPRTNCPKLRPVDGRPQNNSSLTNNSGLRQNWPSLRRDRQEINIARRSKFEAINIGARRQLLANKVSMMELCPGFRNLLIRFRGDGDAVAVSRPPLEIPNPFCHLTP
ncbi:hypothetical protein Zmor_009330 [Zophobas morio]|mgnify:CR=1|uniref:Uncharacterized protein n=1 Tax=Zophobas morio TaxID=2755281 RepID=A0AA38MIM4_9CUCU|nr:hypothetical protein Zmor_009330 [Zophobas morio]